MQINQQNISFSKIVRNIYHSENKFQIYNGLKPALLRHSIYTMMRINIYEHLRDTMKTSDGKLSMSISYWWNITILTTSFKLEYLKNSLH